MIEKKNNNIKINAISLPVANTVAVAVAGPYDARARTEYLT